MAIAVKQLPPFAMASMRFVAAGAVMLALALRRGARLPSGRDWLRTLPIGALLFVGGNGFVAIGERTVSSSGAAVVCATMPIWVGALGALTGERPTVREWSALGLGFAGVLVLMRGPSLAGDPLDVAAICCAPICWALGSLLARRLPKTAATADSFMLPAMQMVGGGVVLAVVSAAAGEPLPVAADHTGWLALLYLWVFGSLIGFTAYSWLLRNTRAAIATSYAFVNPPLAVVFGSVLYGESLGLTTLIANAMIVVAVVLVVVRPRAR